MSDSNDFHEGDAEDDLDGLGALVNPMSRLSNFKISTTSLDKTVNDHKRTSSPMDVINYGSVFQPASHSLTNSQSKLNSNTSNFPSDIDEIFKSSLPITDYPSPQSSTGSKSDVYPNREKPQVCLEYKPPPSTMLAECKNQSSKSNSNLEELLEIFKNRRTTLGNIHPKVAKSLNQIGNAHFHREEFGLAKNAYNDALVIYKHVHGNYHLCVASTLGNLGTLHWRMGLYDESTTFLEESLAIHLKVTNANLNPQSIGRGDDKVDVTGAYHNLGLVRFLAGDFEVALSYLNTALDRRKKIHGNSHVDVARTLDAIGNVYAKKKEPASALKYHHSALRIKKALLGSNHKSVVVSYMNIAQAHKQLNEHEDAINSYRDAYEAQTASSSDSAIIKREIGTIIHSIGLVQMEMQKMFDALHSFSLASRLYIEAGLSDTDDFMIKLKESSSQAKKNLRT